MEKTLINIFVPSVQRSYDIFVPSEAPIFEYIGILAEGVKILSNGRYHVSGKEMLIVSQYNGILDPKLNLNNFDIRDGSKLLMV